MNPMMMNAAMAAAIKYLESNKSLENTMNIIFKNANSMIEIMKNIALPFKPWNTLLKNFLISRLRIITPSHNDTNCMYLAIYKFLRSNIPFLCSNEKLLIN